MNDEPEATGQPDDEPTQPIAPQRPQWAPPVSDDLPLVPPMGHDATRAADRPEPTRPLEGLERHDSLAPSLMPPAPERPPLAPIQESDPASYPQPYAGDTAAVLTVAKPHRKPGGPPAFLWPLVAAMALLVGLSGGLLGALVYDKVIDDSPSGPGYASGGLDDVDLEQQTPLAAPGTVAAVAQAALPSTVQIIAEYGGEDAGATGSGFVMDKNGHVVTNNHVVAEAAKDKGPIVVVDHDRNRYDATVVGRSTVYDLAVLYVEKHDTLKPAKLGSARKLQVGEPVVAIGSPLDLPDTVTSGIVSYLHRPVTTGSKADESSYIDAVQTDAAINPGNSGGPLINMLGEVVGVNSAIATAGGGSTSGQAGNIGVGFAIPVEQVRVTADQILKTGKAQYPVIGAKVKTDGKDNGAGATLDEVVANSPAKAAGLHAGDLITHVNGSRVSDGIALIVAIRTYQPGETIKFTIKRGSETKDISVTLKGEDDK